MNSQKFLDSIVFLVTTFIILLASTVWFWMDTTPKQDRYIPTESLNIINFHKKEHKAQPVTYTISSSTSQTIELTESDIKNATYNIWSDTEKVTLKDGKFESVNNHIGSTINKFAFDDLRKTGKKQAIVSIVTSRADSMEEIFLVAKNDMNIYTKRIDLVVGEGNTMRKIKSIGIDADGVITFDLEVLGPNDPHCCPSISGLYKYKFTLDGEELIWINETSDWKTYKNEKYKFNYPAFYEISHQGNGAVSFQNSKKCVQLEIQGKGAGIPVGCRNTSFSFQNEMRLAREGEEGSVMKVDGIPSYIIRKIISDYFEYIAYIPANPDKDNEFFMLRIVGTSDQTKIAEKEFGGILNSFKFTK
jgi:hypothetical protein